MRGERHGTHPPPKELYERPRAVFIAGFVGNPQKNFFDAQLTREEDRYLVGRQGLEIELPWERGSKAASKEKVTAGVRPEDIALVPDAGDSSEDSLAEVFVGEPLGRDNLVDVRIDDLHLCVLADPRQPMKFGDKVHLQFDGERVQLFDPETEYSLLWT